MNNGQGGPEGKGNKSDKKDKNGKKEKNCVGVLVLWQSLEARSMLG